MSGISLAKICRSGPTDGTNTVTRCSFQNRNCTGNLFVVGAGRVSLSRRVLVYYFVLGPLGVTALHTWLELIFNDNVIIASDLGIRWLFSMPDPDLRIYLIQPINLSRVTHHVSVPRTLLSNSTSIRVESRVGKIWKPASHDTYLLRHIISMREIRVLSQVRLFPWDTSSEPVHPSTPT